MGTNSLLPSSRRRRGNYSMMMAFAILPMLGFGALAMDISYVRLAQSEAQDVADAASNAALIALKTSGDNSTALATATQAADLAIGMNTVVGGRAVRSNILFGIFDETATPQFTTVTNASDRPNAVRVTVARDTAHNNPVGAIFGPIFGRSTYNIVGAATSATRDLDIVLIIDITASFTPANFNNVRLASVSFLDIIGQSFGEHDQVGMVLFSGAFGTRYTEMSNIGDEVLSSGRPIRAAWDKLKTASRPGEYRPHNGVSFTASAPNANEDSYYDLNRKAGDCRVYYNSTWYFDSSYTYQPYKGNYKNSYGQGPVSDTSPKNNFGIGWTALPNGNSCYKQTDGSTLVGCAATNMYKPSLGGCHPDMPREYSDEGGTDHTVGLNPAYDMLAEDATLTSYRAVVLLTDGYATTIQAVPSSAARAGTSPNQLAGYARGSSGPTGAAPPYSGNNYGETRWRTRALLTGHDQSAIRTDAVSLTNGRGATLQANQWVISFGPALTGADYTMMNGMTRGDGYYVNTTTSAGIIPIFQTIARSLPMAVVQ